MDWDRDEERTLPFFFFFLLGFNMRIQSKLL